jgi:hypothetical protein
MDVVDRQVAAPKKARSFWRVAAFGGGIGAGAVVAIALVAVSVYCWSHRVKPWNNRAVTAEYDNLRTEGPNHTFLFGYTLTNNTDQDFRLDDQSDHKFAARLSRENSLSFDDDAKTIRLSYPIYIPAHGRTRVVIHLKHPYISSKPEDPPDGSHDERYDWETKVSRFATDHFGNLGGFAIFDTASRYEIDLPSGWEKRSKEELRLKEIPGPAAEK